MIFRKQITCDSSSVVNADVYNTSGENVGHKFFMYGLFTGNSNKALAKRLKKAHKWADERIKTLEQGLT